MRISSTYPSFSSSSAYNFFFSNRQLLRRFFISLSLAYQIRLSSTFSLLTPLTEVLNFWLTEFSSQFCFLRRKIQLYLYSFSCYLCLKRQMYSFICPFKSSILLFNFPQESRRSSFVSVRQWILSSCFWLRILSFCIQNVDSCSLLLKSFSLPFNFLVMYENREVSLATSFISESWSLPTPNSCRRLMVCNLILKNISSFFILKRFSNLQTLESENSLKLSNSFSNSPGSMCFFNLSIKPQQRLVSSRIFSSFVSFSFLSISMVRVDSPLRKTLALIFSSPSWKLKYLLLIDSEMGMLLDDLICVRPLLTLLGDCIVLWARSLLSDDFWRSESIGFLTYASCLATASLLSLQICLIWDRQSASISFILSCLA